jgi:hypothetical protein
MAIDKADLPKVFDLLDRIATASFPDQLIDELEANVLKLRSTSLKNPTLSLCMMKTLCLSQKTFNDPQARPQGRRR